MKLVISRFICLIFIQHCLGQNLSLLKVSSDSSYIVTEDNQPFFWLGGTAWELIHRLDRKGVDIYLTDRANKGFTVIQTVILAELDGLNSPNAYGEKPLLHNDPTEFNENYFEHVDYVLKKANQLGLYIALLPTWGDKINKKWGNGPEIFTEENAFIYGKLLAKRYVNFNNLVWILGGDRALESDNHFKIIRAMAQGIREIDNRHLISFHPVGARKATDFLEDEWLDFDMYQSGHSRNSKEYTYVLDSKKSSKRRPIINGEARYENIPDRFWEDTPYGWLDDADVRVSAYWSLLAGAAGYTYGCNDVWQMFDYSRIPMVKARTDWEVALHLPGSSQMGFLKKLFELLPWQKMKLNQKLILNDNPEDETFILATTTSDKKVVLAYTPVGKPITLDLPEIDSKKINAYWFNPRSCKIIPIGNFETNKTQEFKPWSNGWGSDFLLVLIAENYKIDFEDWNN